MKPTTYVKFAWILVLSSVTSFAGFKDPSEYGVHYKNIAITFVVNEQGESDMLYEHDILVNNQDGAASSTTDKITHFETDKIQILEAYTLNGSQKIPVAKDKIVSEKLVSNQQGYDAYYTTSLVYPNVKIGSILHIKYRLIYQNHIEPGSFSSLFNFSDFYIEKAKYSYLSKIPLILEKQDPQNVWDIRQLQTKNNFQYDILLKRKTSFGISRESNAFLSKKTATRFAVSSFQDWSTAFPKLKKKYQDLMSVPNKEVAKIAAPFKKIASEEVQLNRILQFISTEFRYFGDWRRVDGGYIPRTITEILSSKYGDCKDLSYLLTLILKELGYQPQIAFIMRGEEDFISETQKLPSIYYFNHAVVYLKTSRGEYWLDPTNVFQYASVIPHDIANKHAFLLPQGELKISTPLDYTKNSFSVDAKILNNDYTGEITWSGMNSSFIISTYWKGDKAGQDFNVLEEVKSYFDIKNYKFGDLKFDKDRYSDARKSFKIQTYDHFTETSEGRAFGVLPAPLRYVFESDLEGRKSDWNLGYPSEKRYRMLLQNEKLKGKSNLSCEVDNEYFKYSRQVQQTPSGVLIQTLQQIKQQYIYNKTLQNPGFQKQIQDSLKCLGRFQVILESQE